MANQSPCCMLVQRKMFMSRLLSKASRLTHKQPTFLVLWKYIVSWSCILGKTTSWCGILSTILSDSTLDGFGGCSVLQQYIHGYMQQSLVAKLRDNQWVNGQIALRCTSFCSDVLAAMRSQKGGETRPAWMSTSSK